MQINCSEHLEGGAMMTNPKCLSEGEKDQENTNLKVYIIQSFCWEELERTWITVHQKQM